MNHRRAQETQEATGSLKSWLMLGDWKVLIASLLTSLISAGNETFSTTFKFFGCFSLILKVVLDPNLVISRTFSLGLKCDLY